MALPVPSLAPQQYLPPLAPAGRLYSPPSPEDPADLHSYIAWFKLREPLLVDTIEKCLVVLSQEKDTLSTLERISEARRDTSGNNVEQQLLPLILTACRGHSGVNKSPFRPS
jgi:hypothetical protein